MGFYVRLFSSASAEIYSNTKTKFTSRLAKPLDLSLVRYEVGLTQISFSKLIAQDTMFYRTTDCIRFDKVDSLPIYNIQTWQMENLAQYLAKISLHYIDYNFSYFRDYTTSDIIFESLAFVRRHPNDFVPIREEHNKFEINLDIKEFLLPSEKASDLLPPNSSSHTDEHVLGDIKIIFNAHLSYTMRQVLNTLIYQIMSQIQISPNERSSFFTNLFTSYVNFDLAHEKYREHFFKANQFIHRVVNGFVEKLLSALSEQYSVKRSDMTQNTQFLVYCDIIRPSMVGNGISKVLCVISDFEISKYNSNNTFLFTHPTIVR